VISHTFPLEDAPKAYKMFHDKKDNCIKVVLKPFENITRTPNGLGDLNAPTAS